MKIFRQDNVLEHYQRLVKQEEKIVRLTSDIYPFFFKDVIFFHDTVLHCWLSKSLKKTKMCSIEFNILLHFSSEWGEEDVFRLEFYMSDHISSYDKNCKCYISCGYTLLKNRTWSKENRPDLIFSFTMENFPIREDVLSKIKEVIEDAKTKFGFEFSDKKEEILEHIK